MRERKIEYIVKSQDDKVIVITEYKPIALEALHNYGGHIVKRVTTVEELKPINKDFTVWN